MRIHSDFFTRHDFNRALKDSGTGAEGVYIEQLSEHGSRSHRRAYDLTLHARDGKDRNGKARRWPNGGSHGALLGYGKAATYDEWGYFIAALYAIDESAKVGPYNGASDFMAQTRYRFDIVAV